MIIRKPIASKKVDYYTTSLIFEQNIPKDFYMWGSIAWPEGDKPGFALMSGLDLDQAQIMIFEQFEFLTVSPWMYRNGSMREWKDERGEPTGEYHVGLVQFFQDNMAVYKCTQYFFGGQHVDLCRRFNLECWKHSLSPKNLQLVEVPYVSEIGEDLILEAAKTDKYKASAGTKLQTYLTQYLKMKSGNVSINNGVLALMALISGYQWLPYVKLQKDEVLPKIIFPVQI